MTLERDLGKGVGFRASYDGNHGSKLGTIINLNQPHTNTQGFDPLATTFPFRRFHISLIKPTWATATIMRAPSPCKSAWPTLSSRRAMFILAT